MPVSLNSADSPVVPAALRDAGERGTVPPTGTTDPSRVGAAQSADRVETSAPPLADLRTAAVRLDRAAENLAEAGAQTDAVTAALRSGQKLSGGHPPVELGHVFEGEISPRRGVDVAKGFHYAPNDGVHPNARVVQELSPRNAHGVYEAQVEITNAASGATSFKRSTMFPDTMRRDDIVQALQNAYDNATQTSGNAFVGPSGHGFDVRGYTSGTGADLHIRTGFPVYTP